MSPTGGSPPRAFRARRRSTDPDDHAWEAFRGWEILFLTAFLVTVVLVMIDGTPRPGGKVVAVILLVVCAAAYLAAGRPAITGEHHDLRAGLVYAAVIAAAFIPATIIAPASSFALFALCPQAFMLLESGWALAAVLLLNTAPAIRFVIGPEVDPAAVLGFLATSAMAVTFAMVFGPWVTRIIHQSAGRAELIEELSASRAEVERLSRERGALAERERLAGEIHDTLAQGFTSVIMLIQAAEAQDDPARHLALAMRTAREGLGEARGLIAALSPAPLDGSTLDEALGRIAARLGEEFGMPVTFTTSGVSRALPPALEVVLIRASQEGLANVRKHAAASRASVALKYGGHEVVLRVRDDGKGFGTPPPAGGYGLRAMRARVEQAGGSLDVRGGPDGGTELTVRLPWKEGLA